MNPPLVVLFFLGDFFREFILIFCFGNLCGILFIKAAYTESCALFALSDLQNMLHGEEAQ